MPAEQSKPSAPRGLGPRGRKLWRAIICDAAGQDISLDSRELVWLEEAGRLADRIEQLEVALSDAPVGGAWSCEAADGASAVSRGPYDPRVALADDRSHSCRCPG
ncbi:Protein of unknown function [Mycobacterium canettii CIPT 140070010]|nr:Protein of unknown function [Mycobacterium canettii CIPT 140070010]